MPRILVLYDIPSDGARTHVADACLDYGLERIQYSAFVGVLGRAHRQELMLRIERILDHEPANVRFILLDDTAWRQQRIINRGTRGNQESVGGSHGEQRDETSDEEGNDDSRWPA